jgi:ribose transport system substrate-binding protein
MWRAVMRAPANLSSGGCRGMTDPETISPDRLCGGHRTESAATAEPRQAGCLQQLGEGPMKRMCNAPGTGRSIIAAITLSLVIATGAAAQEKKTLAFVVNGASDFWKIAEAGVKKAQGELPKYTLQFKYPEQAAAAVQQRVMEDLVAAGVAGIMVSSVDPKNQTDGLNKIAGQTLLFTTDSDAPKSKRVAYIGSSNVDLGKDAGKLMLKALPQGGKCIGFVGLPGADNARERIEGVREVIKGSKVQLTDVRGDEIDQGRAKRNVEDALAANPDVACLVGFYSYNTPRIYEVLKETGKLGKIKVIGFDEDPITLGGVKEGSIVGTVVQQPFEWGYRGMKLMAGYLEGNKSGVPRDGIIIVPGKVIDQSNVEAFTTDLKKMMGK